MMDAPLAASSRRSSSATGTIASSLELKSWRRRGCWYRLKDSILYLFNEMM
jgi:hypothetical protein